MSQQYMLQAEEINEQLQDNYNLNFNPVEENCLLEQNTERHVKKNAERSNQVEKSAEGDTLLGLKNINTAKLKYKDAQELVQEQHKHMMQSETFYSTMSQQYMLQAEEINEQLQDNYNLNFNPVEENCLLEQNTERHVKKNAERSNQVEKSAEGDTLLGLKNINTAKLKYKDAQELVQEQHKHMMQSEAASKLSVTMANEENSFIMRQISAHNKVAEMLHLDREKNNAILTQANKEFEQTLPYSSNATEIDEPLKEDISTLKKQSKFVDKRYQEMFNAGSKQKEQTDNLTKQKSHLEELRKKLNDRKQSINFSRQDRENENIVLKQKISEKRIELGELQKRFYDIENTHFITKEEKDNLHQQLAEEKEKNRDTKDAIKKLSAEKAYKINNLHENLDKLNQRISILNQDIADDTEQSKNELEELQKQRDLILENTPKLEETLNELAQEEIKLEKRKNELSEQCSSKIDMIKTKSRILERELYDLKLENRNKMDNIPPLVIKYTEATKETNDLIVKKTILETKINVQAESIRLLDEKISTKEVEIKNVESDLENLSNNPIVVELEKKKDFAIACKAFLSEKLANADKNRLASKNELHKIINEINLLRNVVETKKMEIKTIKKTSSKKDSANKSVEMEQENHDSNEVAVKSILKKMPDIIPPPPTKRVQFENVPSSDSSLSLTEVPDFDSIIEGFRKRQSQPIIPIKKTKKRRHISD